ncbi:hypothetical protein ACQ86N_45335 [Puia sp. P3]|uniref:hypothetical protein n=1 Tax=Puia sp. P3 TaxID=3423952 RepID=UPI003D6737AC
MRRNLRIELLCIIVAYVPLILFYLVEFQGRLRAISLALLIVGGCSAPTTTASPGS